ncbi:MAG TPA: hypothetical protein VMT00_08345 [Thermoanaerobaculia bacterium]|nr:hypothetical protein [Thermoanaerobaculia bacterium]
MLTLHFAPPRRSRRSHDEEGVEVWRDHQGTIVAWGYIEGDDHWMCWPRLADFHFDRANARVTAHAADAIDRLALIDLFHRSVVPMALQCRGIQVLHASAVATADGVVAFAGSSGSGKSTLAVAVAQGGRDSRRVWCDDGFVFHAIGDQVVTMEMPFRSRLLPDAAAHLGRTASKNARVWAEDDITARIGERRRIAAICELLPSNESGECRITPLSPSSGLLRLLTHAYAFTVREPSVRRMMFDSYAQLTATVPILQLTFPRGLDRLDELAGTLLRDILRISPEHARAEAR